MTSRIGAQNPKQAGDSVSPKSVVCYVQGETPDTYKHGHPNALTTGAVFEQTVVGNASEQKDWYCVVISNNYSWVRSTNHRK